jgi:hypothetical protein
MNKMAMRDPLGGLNLPAGVTGARKWNTNGPRYLCGKSNRPGESIIVLKTTPVSGTSLKKRVTVAQIQADLGLSEAQIAQVDRILRASIVSLESTPNETAKKRRRKPAADKLQTG